MGCSQCALDLRFDFKLMNEIKCDFELCNVPRVFVDILKSMGLHGTHTRHILIKTHSFVLASF